MTIVFDILSDFSKVNYIVILLVLIFSFAYQAIDQNFNPYKKRVIALLKVSSVSRLLRLSFFGQLFLVILYYSNNDVPFYKSLEDFGSLFFENLFHYFGQYFFIFLALIFIIYYSRKKYIINNIKCSEESKRLNYFLEYTNFVFLQCILLFLIFFLSFHFFKFFDEFLFNNHIYPIREFENAITDKNELLYKRGVYYSSIITLTIALLIGNAFHKRSIIDRKKSGWIFISILLITCAGIYSGIYAVLNYFFNAIYEVSDSWKEHDKLIGHAAVRFTALILLWSVIKFIFKNLFGNNLFYFLKQIVIPNKPTKYEMFSLQRSEYELSSFYNLYYFSQVGFYVLNVLIAEILIITGDGLGWLNLFFSFLPIMVDDYLAIHYYFEKFNHMKIWHRRKKLIFNILLFSFSIILLFSMGMMGLILIYITITIMLLIINPNKDYFSINEL